MPAGIWGRAAKLVFISIMVDTTEYSTFCLKALKAYLLHFTAHKISNLENFYIEVLRTSQRGNQVEKVGENALRLKYYRNVQKILIRDESERFYCDLEVGTYFVQSLPTSTSQNTDSPTMRVFFCCRWSSLLPELKIRSELIEISTIFAFYTNLSQLASCSSTWRF